MRSSSIAHEFAMVNLKRLTILAGMSALFFLGPEPTRASHTPPATIFVDDSNPGCPGTGTLADPFCTIEGAIGHASAGDTIDVAAGTYVPDGSLSGWVIPARDPESAPLVFYFGGNGEDVSVTGLDIRVNADANFVLMNYRGYGTSEGAPSESALFADALFTYDTLTAATPHNGKIVAFGRSLGFGVAVYLSAQRRIDALVLVTPYDSIRNVARRRFP